MSAQTPSAAGVEYVPASELLPDLAGGGDTPLIEVPSSSGQVADDKGEVASETSSTFKTLDKSSAQPERGKGEGEEGEEESSPTVQVPLSELKRERQKRQTLEDELKRYSFDVWRQIQEAPPDQQRRMLESLLVALGHSPQPQTEQVQQQEPETDQPLNEFWQDSTENEKFLYTRFADWYNRYVQYQDAVNRQLIDAINNISNSLASVSTKVTDKDMEALQKKLEGEMVDLQNRWNLSDADVDKLWTIWEEQGDDGYYDRLAEKQGKSVFEVILKNEMPEVYENRIRRQEYRNIATRQTMTRRARRSGSALSEEASPRELEGESPEERFKSALERAMSESGWKPVGVAEQIPL